MSETNNPRCPFREECDRLCQYQFKELDCSFYSANAMPGAEIPDQEKRRNKLWDDEQGDDEDIQAEDMDAIIDCPEEKNCSCQGCENAECVCAGMKNSEERSECDGANNCQQDGCTFSLKHRAVAQAPDAGSRSSIVMIPIDHLHPHPDNPRKEVGDVTELAESIKANGVLQNLTVVPYVSPVQKRVIEGLYTVIIGHRRLAASEKAGLTEVPCVIVEMSEKDQLSTMLTENMQRVDLTIYEQAQGFQLMLDMGDSMEQIVEKSGFSKTTVRKRLEIAKLDEKTLKKVSTRQVTLGDFDELAKINDIEVRNKVLNSIGTNNFNSELQNALREQNLVKRMEEWISALRTFAVEEPDVDFATKQYIRNYGYYNQSAEVVVPEDAGTRKYYFRVGKSQIDLYADPDTEKENAEKAAREARQRKDDLIREIFEDLNHRHSELRDEFLKKLSNAVCRKNTATIFSYCANITASKQFSYHASIDLKKLGYLLSIKIEKDALENGSVLTDCAGIRSSLEAAPEKTLLCIAYCASGNSDSGYSERFWTSGHYEYRHSLNAGLDAIYSVLTALGYDMSDEERDMKSGKYVGFTSGVNIDPDDLDDDDIEEDEDSLEELLDEMGDPFDDPSEE